MNLTFEPSGPFDCLTVRWHSSHSPSESLSKSTNLVGTGLGHPLSICLSGVCSKSLAQVVSSVKQLLIKHLHWCLLYYRRHSGIPSSNSHRGWGACSQGTSLYNPLSSNLSQNVVQIFLFRCFLGAVDPFTPNL